MRRSVVLAVLVVVSWLSGCTAIDLQTLAPPAPNEPDCQLIKDGRAPVYQGLLLTGEPTEVARVDDAIRNGESYAGHLKSREAALDRLPRDIRDDKVTRAFFRSLHRSFAAHRLSALATTANLDEQGCSNLLRLRAEVATSPVDSILTHREIEAFATKVMGIWLRPQLELGSQTRSGSWSNDSFDFYFKSYYDKKFVDRFGRGVPRPEISKDFPISIAISDADIASAEVVLLEYIFDVIDPTPIFGDTDLFSATTKFFPGDARPTIVDAFSDVPYLPLSRSGLNADEINKIVQLADALGDRAAALGGLTFNSIGGVGISLGFFGKFSVGDNQTLSVLAKKAVSRFAARLSYASSVALLRGRVPARGGGYVGTHLSYPQGLP